MSKKQRKQKNKIRTEEFQTGFAKSEWYGSGRRNRPKHKVKNKNLYKKTPVNSGARNDVDTAPNKPQTDENKPISTSNVPAIATNTPVTTTK